MVTNAAQEWLFVCVLSLLGTNSNLISAAARNALYKSAPAKGSAARWSVDLLKKKISVSELSQTEPGFDLTDEEIKKLKLWPHGIISYYIDDFSFDKVLRDRIRSFLDLASGLTGLHFQELPSPPKDNMRWIFFVNRQGLLGCSDHTTLNFTNEGVQKVTLGYNCMSEGGELAEAVLAIAGVPPQHNSPDRDEHITVEMDNILPEKQYLFQKLRDSDWLFHDLEYDFASAGHFNFHKHTIKGLATITPKATTNVPVGENDGFSYTDILKVRMLYNFISKNKIKTIKGPECNKLFEPGVAFSTFTPNKKDKVKPREKPNKYLGLPDNESNKGKKGENVPIKGEEEGEEKYKEQDRKGAEEHKDEEEEENSEKDNNNDDADYRANKASQSWSRETMIKPGVNVDTVDPISIISDYNTEDDRQKKLQQRKKKQNRTRKKKRLAYK